VIYVRTRFGSVKGGPNHLVSSEIQFVKIVSCVLRVLREFVFAPFLRWLDSSF
jgi:hypothetical protein